MILLGREAIGTIQFERAKARVLAALGAGHHIERYEEPEQLAAFCDQTVDGIAELAPGLPRGLQNVLLFTVEPDVDGPVVAARMAAGGRLQTFRLPEAWDPLMRSLPELERFAARQAGGDEPKMGPIGAAALVRL